MKRATPRGLLVGSPKLSAALQRLAASWRARVSHRRLPRLRLGRDGANRPHGGLELVGGDFRHPQSIFGLIAREAGGLAGGGAFRLNLREQCLLVGQRVLRNDLRRRVGNLPDQNPLLLRAPHHPTINRQRLTWMRRNRRR